MYVATVPLARGGLCPRGELGVSHHGTGVARTGLSPRLAVHLHPAMLSAGFMLTMPVLRNPSVINPYCTFPLETN